MSANPKRRVVRSLGHGFRFHRGDFETCPHCDKKFDTGKWEAAATTLVLDIVQGKHGAATVVSECPACFKGSWVHVNFNMFDKWYGKRWPAGWPKAALAERDRRHLEGLIEFCGSLCVRCANIRALDASTHCWVKCTMGRPVPVPDPRGIGQRLDSGSPRTECSAFLERKKHHVPA